MECKMNSLSQKTMNVWSKLCPSGSNLDSTCIYQEHHTSLTGRNTKGLDRFNRFFQFCYQIRVKMQVVAAEIAEIKF